MVNIKKCSVNDLKQIKHISELTYKKTFSHLNTQENMSSYIEQAFNLQTLKEEIENPNSTFYIAYVENNIAGYLKINEDDAQTDINDCESIEIQRIFILEEFQGKGIGKLFINHVYKIAKEKQKSYIWLGVWEHNQKAISFYKIIFMQHVNLTKNKMTLKGLFI